VTTVAIADLFAEAYRLRLLRGLEELSRQCAMPDRGVDEAARLARRAGGGARDL